MTDQFRDATKMVRGRCISVHAALLASQGVIFDALSKNNEITRRICDINQRYVTLPVRDDVVSMRLRGA